ncbi:hypothetical protein Tco_0766269 [Tanacetum coccineum]
MKNKVEAHHRKFKSSANMNNHVLDCNEIVKNVAMSKNSDTICLSCNKCLFSLNHDACVVQYLKKMQKCKVAKYSKQKVKSEWKLAGRVFTSVGLRWKLTGRMVNMEGKIIQTSPTTIVPSGNRLHAIRIPDVAPNAETRMRYSIAKNSLIRAHINSYGHPLNPPNFSFARNSTIPEQSSWNFKFLAIMGYGDLQMGNILISHVYYVEGLGHNLFSAGQFCDSDLEVAFRKHTCFVRNLKCVDLLSGSCGSNLYTISMADMIKSSPILVLNQDASTSAKPPIKNDWDFLFQPMFDEYFKFLSVVSTPISAATLLPPDTGEASSYSFSIDQDAPSSITSPNIEVTNSLINSTNVEQNDEVAEFDSDTFTNPFAPPKTSSAESSSRINYKEAMEESCWIKAMQEEIHEFEWLELWELVPRPDRAMIVDPT